METVGVYLKRERQSKNLSLREVARLTKISVLYLDCIEKDDYEKIPKGPYVKGYISSYSRMIGVDTDQALKLYESANEKKSLADLPPQPVTPPLKGWRASVATAIAAFRDWLDQRKKRKQNASPQGFATGTLSHPPPSLLDKKITSIDTARPAETSRPATNDEAGNRKSSVLIPFKQFTQPAQASHAIDNESGPIDKTDWISSAATIISIYQKIIDLLKVVGLGVKSLFLGAATKHRMLLPSRNVLVTLTVLLMGVTVLVFCGIGVYHVFFFDKQAPPMTAETTVATGKDSTAAPSSPTIVTDNDSTAAPSSPSQSTMPHKTSRLKKPSLPMPAVTIVAPSPPPERPTLADQQSGPSQHTSDQSSRLPKPTQTQETAAITETEATQPADINVKLLKATICSAIKDRMPNSISTVYPLSVNVYVWSHIQAEQYPTTIWHLYYHEGQIVNRVELDVRAPFWRTWSYKRIDKDHYDGHWRVDITTADHKLLRRLYFEIN
jgi:cytoskeletal protein RodZ